MSEWWTYALSDFLLFSPRVYYRLLQLHNRELWPLQLLAAGLGTALGWLVWRPPRHGGRLVCATLGALWIWIAWAFFWERYATINWAAVYVAPAFVLQGGLLIWLGAIVPRVALSAEPGARRGAAMVLFVLALAGYPLLAPLLGRPWWAAESFGLMPDPTAVATLAVLACAAGRVRWLLLILPALWCVITGATLWAMEAGDALAAPVAAVAALAAAVRRPRAAAGCG